MHIKKNGLRFSFLIIFFLVCLFAFAIRLVLIQVFRSDYLSQLADKQHNQLIELEPIRGTIYDRMQRPLAVNVSVYSLFANPRMMTPSDKQKAIAKLSSLLGLEPSFLKDRLERKKFFVWIKRKISSE